MSLVAVVVFLLVCCLDFMNAQRDVVIPIRRMEKKRDKWENSFPLSKQTTNARTHGRCKQAANLLYKCIFKKKTYVNI